MLALWLYVGILVIVGVLGAGLGLLAVRVGRLIFADDERRPARVTTAALALSLVAAIVLLHPPLPWPWRLPPLRLPDAPLAPPSWWLDTVLAGSISMLLEAARRYWSEHRNASPILLELGRERTGVWGLAYLVLAAALVEALLLTSAAVDLLVVQADAVTLAYDAVALILVPMAAGAIVLAVRWPVRLRSAGITIGGAWIPWTKIAGASWEGTPEQPLLRLRFQHWTGLHTHRFAVSAGQMEAAAQLILANAGISMAAPLPALAVGVGGPGSRSIALASAAGTCGRHLGPALGLVGMVALTGGAAYAAAMSLAPDVAPAVGPGAFRASGRPAIVGLGWESGLLARDGRGAWRWLLRDRHLTALAATRSISMRRS